MIQSGMSPLLRLFICVSACLALLGWTALSVAGAPGHLPGNDAMFQDDSYRAGLYAGDCGTITLANAIATGDSTPQSGSDESGWSWSFTMTLDAAIDDLTATPHAISIEMVESDLAGSLACAELTGEIFGDALIVPLTTTESNELVGIAAVSETDDQAVVVELYLVLAADGAPLRPVDENGMESDPGDSDEIDDSIDVGDMVDADDDDGDDDDDGNPEGGV